MVSKSIHLKGAAFSEKRVPQMHFPRPRLKRSYTTVIKKKHVE